MKWNDVRIGTLGGTLCSVWASISLGSLLDTALLALVGSLVSYGCSRMLAYLRRRRQR